LSVEAVQARLIWPLEAAVAVKLAGAVGAAVSEDDVVAVEVEEKLLRFPAASVARTR